MAREHQLSVVENKRHFSRVLKYDDISYQDQKLFSFFAAY